MIQVKLKFNFIDQPNDDLQIEDTVEAVSKMSTDHEVASDTKKIKKYLKISY